MKPLIKVMLILAAIFASTFVIARMFGLFDLEQIRTFLTEMKAQSQWWVGPIITLLLFADLFIAVPTLSICILSGYLLGFPQGFAFSLLGICLAGCIGYLLSRLYGDRFVRLIVRKDEEREQMRNTFQNYGVIVILLSRALPILPEVSACMSGVTRMRVVKFVLAWLAVNIPYIAIASYSGSISSMENPFPALITAAGLSLFFWTSWLVFHRYSSRDKQTKNDSEASSNLPEDVANEI